MNKFLKFFACLLIFSLPARMQLVNEVVVIIYHEMGTIAILASDIRPALDGHMQTLREVILNALMKLDGLYHKIIVTQEEAEKYIENIQKQNKLSRKAVEDLFTSAGYTYAEALEYLRGRQIIEQVVEFRVKSDKRMIVSREEAQARYDENPPMVEAIYTLAIAFISQEKLGKKKLSDYLKTIDLDKDIQFDEPFDLKESEIADDRKVITTHKAGDIVFTEQVEGGYEITRLVDITPASIRPLFPPPAPPRPENPDLWLEYDYMAGHGAFDNNSCSVEIVAEIRKERLKEVFESYYKLLLSQATIRFTHPEDAKVLESTEMI
jgi:hypothetical protein